jgi:hypothetical protein
MKFLFRLFALLFFITSFGIKPSYALSSSYTSVDSALKGLMNIVNDNCYEPNKLRGKRVSLKLNRGFKQSIIGVELEGTSGIDINYIDYDGDLITSLEVIITDPEELIDMDEGGLFCSSKRISFKHKIIRESYVSAGEIQSEGESSCRINLSFKSRNKLFEMSKIKNYYHVYRRTSDNLEVLEDTQHGYAVRRLDNKAAWAKITLRHKKSNKILESKVDRIDKCAKFEVKPITPKKPILKTKTINADDFIYGVSRIHRANNNNSFLLKNSINNCLRGSCYSCDDGTRYGSIEYKGTYHGGLGNKNKNHAIKCDITLSFPKNHPLSRNDFNFQDGYFIYFKNHKVKDKMIPLRFNKQQSFILSPNAKNYIDASIHAKVNAKRFKRMYWRATNKNLFRSDLNPDVELDCYWKKNGKKKMQVPVE